MSCSSGTNVTQTFILFKIQLLLSSGKNSKKSLISFPALRCKAWVLFLRIGISMRRFWQKSGGFRASGPANTAEAAVAFAITHKCIVIPDARASVIRLF